MLQFDFNIEPDANGIFDGRELANAMIQAAYALLAPYVKGCPACSDALFSAVANGAIEALHRDNDGIPCKIMSVEADGARWKRHAAETSELTDALMSNSPFHVH